MDYVVHQWTHSIINEWKASINALDLAFAMSEASLHGEASRSFARDEATHSRKGLRVKFNHNVELYVGDEHEHFFQGWRLHCNTPVREARIFRPLRSPLADETSFMSMGTFDRNRPFGPEARHEDRIADREDVAIDPDIEFVEADEEAYSTDNEGTASTGRPEQDWFATLLFALDHQPIPLRVDWNDLEDMQRSAAHVLEISNHNLFYLHHVQHAPQDLVDAGVEVLIGHRHGDIAQGSSLQLVLLDVEFHSAVPAIQHEVVRRIVRIPRQIGRLALLHRLGLAAYCRRTKQNCILWCNGEIISHYSARPMDIMHGTYLRIAVPPGDNTINHIGTRCIATA